MGFPDFVARIELPHAGEAARRAQAQPGDGPVHALAVQRIAGAAFAPRADLVEGLEGSVVLAGKGVDLSGNEDAFGHGLVYFSFKLGEL